MKYIYVYVTVLSNKDAESITEHILKGRIAACVNCFPVKSTYLWKGKIEKANEYVLLIKTIEQLFPQLERKIKKMHPYKIPCITKINVKPNDEYATWILKEIGSS
ncbi:divalent-cation tolerance protein CutA [Candidatus Woesearchaeota archaeon]|nr:divalent-cation tolerance protein CutA [Candidatus Woesearchaeota archaeon]